MKIIQSSGYYFYDTNGNKSILFGDIESAELFANGAEIYYQDCK